MLTSWNFEFGAGNGSIIVFVGISYVQVDLLCAYEAVPDDGGKDLQSIGTPIQASVCFFLGLLQTAGPILFIVEALHRDEGASDARVLLNIEGLPVLNASQREEGAGSDIVETFEFVEIGCEDRFGGSEEDFG